jgi:putative DNA primase/helicase
MTLKTKKTNAQLDAEVIELDERKEASSTARLHILPSPAEPLAVAREFVQTRCLFDEHLKLHYWRAGWWFWKTAHWTEVDEDTVSSVLYQYTGDAMYFTDAGEPQPWRPNKSKIANLMDALKAVCLLPTDIDQPCWLDDPNDGVIVAMANGLLDVAQRELLPHTPLFFNQTTCAGRPPRAASMPTVWCLRSPCRSVNILPATGLPTYSWTRCQ